MFNLAAISLMPNYEHSNSRLAPEIIIRMIHCKKKSKVCSRHGACLSASRDKSWTAFLSGRQE